MFAIRGDSVEDPGRHHMDGGQAPQDPSLFSRRDDGASRRFTKRYVDTASGAVHLRETRVGEGRALYCLHATAYSGQTFEPLLNALGGRRVVAPDMAGYGASDPPSAPWTIGDYADSLAQTIVAAGDGPVDLLGYHTGAFVAVDLAARRPDLVRRLILIGVPYYTGEARAERQATLARRTTLGADLAQFAERWSFFITNRAPGQTMARGFANFVDELRAYPDGWMAHEAAFTYEPEESLRALTQAVLILNPDNHLSEPSRRAAGLIRNVRLIEMPHLQHAIFDVASAEIGSAIERFVDVEEIRPAPLR